MHAIVSLLKKTILVGLFVFLTIALVAILLVATADPSAIGNKPPILAGIAAVTFLVFLAHAGIAVVLSIHDRHNEIAEGIHRIADELELQRRNGPNS